MEVTLENIRSIFRSEVDVRVDVENMDADSSITDQGVDSLDRSSAFLALEESFGVTITDRDIEELVTLNKILNFIKKSKQ
jgi:acyl carrier protein